jgi:hypothetical protein
MEKKRVDYYLLIGIFFNLLLVGFFLLLYFMNQPNEADITVYKNDTISSVKIYNEKLDQEINNLKKIDSLPISIDPNELGKENPYK